MRKEIKNIVISAIAALTCGALSVGTTFALFTSEANTKINIESGIVDIDQQLEIFSVSELGDVAVSADSEGVYTNSIGGKTYFDAEQGALKLERWAPGDKAVIKLTNKNKSNVSIKTRFTHTHTSTSNPDLYDALNIGYAFASGYSEAITQSNYKLWTALEPAVSNNNTISTITITIEFPDGDNGEILYGEANNDNKYQNTNCSIFFCQEAVQGNAFTDDILNQINFALEDAALVNGKNATMHDALADLTPFLIEKIEERGYVWGINTDQFFEFEQAPENAHEYFRMYDAMPDSQNYSIYAIDGNWGASLSNLTVGFDVGNVEGITSINYDRSEAQTGQNVIIRTNSLATAVTINAPKDVVKHYGDASNVNIIAVAGSSYHEFGTVAFTEISAGRIVLEEGSKTNQIHLNAKDDNSFDDIRIANNGLAAAELPDKITRDQIEVTGEAEKALVVVVEDLVAETEEPVYAYPYSYVVEEQSVPAGTTEKTASQNTNVESDLGMKVIDSNDHEGEKALAPEQKSDAREDAIEEVISDEGFVAQISTKFYKTFDAAFSEVTNNDVLYVINDCSATDKGIHAYDASGLNLTIEVKAGVTLSCGDVTNGKFNIGWNNAVGTFILDGEGKITFNTNSNWGLVTQNGSGNNIKVTVKNVTIEASVDGGKIMTAGNLTVESGHYKNITFLNGQIKKGFKAEYNPDTGYMDIVVAPPADAVFLATPNDPSVPSEYITPAQIEDWYLQTAPAFSGGNYTLKLLNDHTINTINEWVYDDFRGIIIKGDNIVIDLNGKTLSYIGSSYNLFDGAGMVKPHNVTIKNGTLIATGNYYSNIDIDTLRFENVSMALHSNNAVDTLNGYYDANRYFYIDCSQSTMVYAYTAFMATVYDYVVPGECDYEYSVKAVIGGQNVFCKGSKALYNFTGELLGGDFRFYNSEAGRDIYVYSSQDYKGTASNQTYNLALRQNVTVNLHLGENAGTIKVGGPISNKYAKKISDNGSSPVSFYNGSFFTISTVGTHTLVIS